MAPSTAPLKASARLVQSAAPRQLQRYDPRPLIRRAQRQAVAPSHNHRACTSTEHTTDREILLGQRYASSNNDSSNWAPSRRQPALLTLIPAGQGGLHVASARLLSPYLPTYVHHIISLVDAHLGILGSEVRPAGGGAHGGGRCSAGRAPIL